MTDTTGTDLGDARAPPASSRPVPANRASASCRPATSPSMPGWRWRGVPSARSTSSTTTWPSDSVGLQFLRELRDAAGRGVRVRLLVDDLYHRQRGRAVLQLRRDSQRRGARCSIRCPRAAASVLSRIVSLAARVQPHQPQDAQQAVHRRQPLLGLRRPQHGRRVLHAQHRGQLHRHGRDRRPGRSCASCRRCSTATGTATWPTRSCRSSQALAPSDRRRRQRAALRRARCSPRHRSSCRPTPIRSAAPRSTSSSPPAASPWNSRSPPSSPTRRTRARCAIPATPSPRSTAAFSRSWRTARDELLIASPYFIPGKVGMERLREVIDRKVRIRVVTNGVGATDEPLVHWRYARYRLTHAEDGDRGSTRSAPTLAARSRRVRHLRPELSPAARQGGGVRPASGCSSAR